MLARAQHSDVDMASRASLNEIAMDLVALWREPIEKKGLQLIFQPGIDSGSTYNTTFLQAVMGNLLRNAAHYTDKGFIKLAIEHDGFTVEDSGVGIPAEKREAMFQPFVRGSEKRGEGLGLGLSLVQRICDDQGWVVTLLPSMPHGCRFQVHLSKALVDAV
ncbi:Adaptive-response sensory-kinase SasA [compost metagenome]